VFATPQLDGLDVSFVTPPTLHDLPSIVHRHKQPGLIGDDLGEAALGLPRWQGAGIKADDSSLASPLTRERLRLVPDKASIGTTLPASAASTS
jgi:hypothetical protein